MNFILRSNEYSAKLFIGDQSLSAKLVTMPPRGRHFIKHGGSSMKEILLSQNKKALVDDAVYPLLSEFKWCYRGGTNNQPGYAVRNIKSDGKVRLLYLHHLVVPLEPGKEVIFLNHD